MPQRPLDLETRRRIVDLVREYAGLHLREVARQLDTSVALVEYHLPVLEEAGLVHVDRGDRYVRLYPAGPRVERPTGEEREWLNLLREPLPLQVTLFLLDHPGPARHGKIREALDLGKGTLSFHLGKLADAGLVAKRTGGLYDIADRPRVSRLLITHRPTPDLVARFARLWLAFYGDAPRDGA